MTHPKSGPQSTIVTSYYKFAVATEDQPELRMLESIADDEKNIQNSLDVLPSFATMLEPDRKFSGQWEASHWH